MTFEEWLETRPYVDIDDFLRDAWEAAFEEGYKFAHKENEEYDKIGC